MRRAQGVRRRTREVSGEGRARGVRRMRRARCLARRSASARSRRCRWRAGRWWRDGRGRGGSSDASAAGGLPDASAAGGSIDASAAGGRFGSDARTSSGSAARSSSGSAPGAVPGALPGAVLEATPGAGLGATPGAVLEALPGAVPGATPGAIPGATGQFWKRRQERVRPRRIPTPRVPRRILYPHHRRIPHPTRPSTSLTLAFLESAATGSCPPSSPRRPPRCHRRHPPRYDHRRHLPRTIVTTLLTVLLASPPSSPRRPPCAHKLRADRGSGGGEYQNLVERGEVKRGVGSGGRWVVERGEGVG
ncbi:uncharacterized protein SCHCODRAFT_02044260 [Schizophyllum commune H4-8]|uniref:uncharacterized protein n=1 Tax=Schizophyllum commune (strain H4-8 / FGSC 9210) TaxID=578458 RepID=UPI0021610BA9|nr:uncharacterized protein SCHCODRAFT_02044260 [Schizophyllum commune H4-8]KAI5900807.1 hypothetical protein SCHCODRAFT_02044260 [Schizophyllum commune H4-8]